MIKGLLFDLDGTIIDSEFSMDKINADLVSKLAKDVTYNRDEVKYLIAGKTSLEGADYIVKKYNLPISAEEFNTERNISRSDEYANKISFIDGFTHFYISLMRNYSLPTAIATGCDKFNFEMLNLRLNLREMFHNNISFSEGIKSKPAPDIYLVAANSIHINPESCLVFEDAPNGMVSALYSGAKVIALTKTFDQQFLINKCKEISGGKIDIDKIRFISDYQDNSVSVVKDWIESS